jgi:hypothetical protein
MIRIGRVPHKSWGIETDSHIILLGWYGFGTHEISRLFKYVLNLGPIRILKKEESWRIIS